MELSRFLSRHWREFLIFSLVILALIAPTRDARATDYIWSTTGSWYVSGNWSPTGVPTSTDTAIIVAGTAIVASPGATAFQTLLNGSLNISDGGSLTNAFGVIGLSSGYNSTVSVGGGSGTSTWLNSTSLIVGNSGTGTLNINAGGLVITPDLAGGNATSSVNFNGGILRITATDSASNTMNLLAAGGTIDVPTTANTFTMTGNIGGAGSLTKTGEGTLTLSGHNTYAGVTTLNGGILSISSANALGNSGLVTFNGGTLGAAGTFSSGFNFTILAASGTINVPTAGNTFTLSGGITGSNFGGLTKNGVGTLVLTGTSSFNGDLIVDIGGLTIANGANVTCNSGIISSRYGGGAVTGAVTVGGSGGGATWNMTGTLSVGNYYPGTLTVNSGSTVNSRNFYVGPGQNSAYSSATVRGSLNTGFVSIAAGTLVVPAGGVLNSGDGSIRYGSVLVDGGTWNMPQSEGPALYIVSTDVNPYSLTITNGGSVIAPYTAVLGLTTLGAGYAKINIGGGTGTSTLNTMRGLDLSDALCIINLNTGGVLNTTYLYTYNSGQNYNNSFVNVGFNGGTLRINTTCETSAIFTIGAGGGTIDLPSADTTFTLFQSRDINGTAGGGLNKTGPGTLVLKDIGCNINGPLTITNGTLACNTELYTETLSSTTGNIAPTAGMTASVIIGANANNTTWTMSGALTVGGSGSLTVNTGAIVTAAALNGNGEVILNNGGTLRITGTDSSTNTIRLPFYTGTIDVPTAGTTVTLSGAIDGVGTFFKTGPGTLEITAASTTRGGTVVNTGKLLANNTSGSATGYFSVIVNSGATLAGGNATGTQGFIAPDRNITGNMPIITIDGILSPGNGPASIGVLTIGKASQPTVLNIPGTYAFSIATTNAGSTTAINNGSSSATRTSTTGNNLLAILGTNASTVNFTGATIQLNASSVNLGGNWDNSKFFSWQLATLPEGVTPTLGTTQFDTTGFSPSLNGGSFSLSFVDATNSLYLNYSPVPEPGLTFLACAVGVVGWFSRRKIRRCI